MRFAEESAGADPSLALPSGGLHRRQQQRSSKPVGPEPEAADLGAQVVGREVAVHVGRHAGVAVAHGLLHRGGVRAASCQTAALAIEPGGGAGSTCLGAQAGAHGSPPKVDPTDRVLQAQFVRPPLWQTLPVPCSRPEHFERAAVFLRERMARDAWPDDHPAAGWPQAAEELASRLVGGGFSGTPGLAANDDPTIVRAVDAVVVPALRACWLAWAWEEAESKIAGIGGELARLREAGHFSHTEYVLRLAAGLAHALDTQVVGVPTSKSGRRPDIDLPDLGVSIEAKSRANGDVDGGLGTNFENAERKFRDYLCGDRAHWRGMLAVDFGVCGDVTLPDAGRRGPRIGALESEAESQFEGSRRVAMLLVTQISVKVVEDAFVPADSSWLLYPSRRSWRNRRLSRCFFTRPDRSRTIVRSEPGCC